MAAAPIAVAALALEEKVLVGRNEPLPLREPLQTHRLCAQRRQHLARSPIAIGAAVLAIAEGYSTSPSYSGPGSQVLNIFM